MTSKRATSHHHPLQLLLAGSEEQRALLQNVLRTHAGNSDIDIENAANLDEVQARVSSHAKCNPRGGRRDT